ncbi:MAG: hypothetical protein JXP34_26700 [Planctomycetes bacterium]|nr:hypothetical protein [Planctomycetota bacterium]
MTTAIAAIAMALSAGPAPGTHAHYRVLTAQPHTPPPFDVVDVVYGPREGDGVWWQLSVRKKDDGQGEPILRLRALTPGDPLAGGSAPRRFDRYILRIPETGETLDYRDVHTKRALLPAWRAFRTHFVPRRGRGSRERDGVPETAEYLGHVLTLIYVGHGVPWEPWEDVDRLDLDPELLVGTGRSFRDSELRRLPQQPERQNYSYVPFVESEYPVMIEAGINLFIVSAAQEPWVRGKPVFYLRGAGKDMADRYPADLYRSNYIGPVMFMDEPSIIMVGDKNIHDTLRHFTDAAVLITRRVEARYRGAGSYGAYRLEKGLIDLGINFGAMRLEQSDYPAWETLYDTAYYQLAGGLAGIVHEGRYRLAPFDRAIERWTGTPKAHTARELLRYHYAFLRGAARAFGKSWGTSIYGQCDPAISPEAVTLAYDMGARYVWFWTSDHDHHMPWPEQLELARTLRDHAKAHPRLSIRAKPPVLDLAIAIPYGYFLSLDNLWWVRALDEEGKNEASQRYARLMRRAHRAIEEALEKGEEFDITVDDGRRSFDDYKRVVRVSDEM